MASVEVGFTALPAHVRTARLIALAVARRAGVPEELLDEIKLAVGEACSRAVGINGAKAPDTPVRMSLSDGHGRFVIDVVDVGPLEASVGGLDLPALDPDALTPAVVTAESASIPDPLPPGFGLAVISGLVEEVGVASEGDGTHVRMSWPAPDAYPDEHA